MFFTLKSGILVISGYLRTVQVAPGHPVMPCESPGKSLQTCLSQDKSGFPDATIPLDCMVRPCFPGTISTLLSWTYNRGYTTLPSMSGSTKQYTLKEICTRMDEGLHENTMFASHSFKRKISTAMMSLLPYIDGCLIT
jgi:hypothetical protein